MRFSKLVAFYILYKNCLKSFKTFFHLVFVLNFNCVCLEQIVQCDAIRSEQLKNLHFFSLKPMNHIFRQVLKYYTFARDECGQVGVFNIKIRSLVQKLLRLEKCQFSNCSHLIASHCKGSRKVPTAIEL